MHSNTNSRRIGAGSLAVVLALARSGCGAFGGKGKPTTPTELAEVHFNANEAGTAPKEGEERQKTPAEAPK